MNHPITFDAVLRHLLQTKGVTSYAVARRTDYDPSHLHRLANGSRVPTRGAVLAIANALGASDAERDDLLTAGAFATDAAMRSLADRYRP